MPLNGAGLASKPSGTTAVSNTTIESSKFNSVIDDIYSIFNTARPIVYGGTGGTSVITGWDGLAAKGTDIASSGTINLTTATGPLIDITGTTAISTVTLAEGAVRIARATGAFRLTASSTLIVRGSTSQSYTTTARDLLIFRGYGSSVVHVDVISNAAGANPYPPGTLYGLTLSNNGSDATNDIDIAVGSARDSTDAANIDLLSALTKQLDVAWAVGTNAGMLATGAGVANTTYYIFVIKRPDTGVVDIAADTSSTGANIAANTNAAYTIKRQIGYVVRAGGVNGVPTWTDSGRQQTGTFTPTISFGGASVGATYTTQTGRYTKIGNRVNFSIRVTLSAKGSSTGAMLINGLPFTSAAVQQPVAPWGTNTNTTPAYALVATSSTTITIWRMSGGVTATQLADTDINNTTDFMIGGQYEVA